MNAFGRAATWHRIGLCTIMSVLAGALGSSVAEAGPPFLTDDTDTQEAGHFEINIAAQYIRFKGGSNGAIPSVEVNYGVTDNLQITILTPLSVAHVDGAGTHVGLGDTRLSFKFRFVEADDQGWKPNLAIAPTIILPSGNASRGLGDGQITGFVPLWVTKEFKPWTVFGGGGYNINTGTDDLNWWFFGAGVLRELDPKWTVGAEIFHSTPTGRGLKESTGLNVGVIYNISDTHHLMLAVSRNLVNARENNEFSTYLGYQLTF